jgi:hypothetical protein
LHGVHPGYPHSTLSLPICQARVAVCGPKFKSGQLTAENWTLTS